MATMSGVRDSASVDEATDDGSEYFMPKPVMLYDVVKLKVWLHDHYYIFSRFLMSRLLQSVGLPHEDSIEISILLKKHLVDQRIFEVKREAMEEALFKIMASKGFGDKYISNFRMLARFNEHHVPVVILICGGFSTGKSALALSLSERLNIPNVLQTELVFEMIHIVLGGDRDTRPCWLQVHSDMDAFLQKYTEECDMVKKAIDGDIKKAFSDGKSIIIEGQHINPSLIQSVMAQATGKEALIIPFLIEMNPKENKILLEQRFNSMPVSVSKFAADLETLRKNNDAILQVLRSFFNNRHPIICVDLHSTEATINDMHALVLSQIQKTVNRLEDTH